VFTLALPETLSVLFCLALAGVALGIRLAEIPAASNIIVPFSGGLLMGIAFFWVFPEVEEMYGWMVAVSGAAAGFVFLYGVNRFIYPVCPACSHSHDHAACAKSLHGFTPPLVAAASVHSFFDGWSLAVSEQPSAGGLRWAILLGIGIHKIPEGVALGVLLLNATGSVWRSAIYAIAVQSSMGVGALAAVFLASHLAPHWTSLLLASAAGVFVYLGYHAIEGQSQRGLGAVMMPALTGAAGAAILRLVPGF
jgi:zinc transporter ZupT